MVSKALLTCAVLACCLAAAQACGSNCFHVTGGCHCWKRRRSLRESTQLSWRKGVVHIAQVVGCADEDEGTPCLAADEVVDAVHNKVVNATVLSLESERPDARLDAWRGQVLSFFFNDANSTTVDGTFDPADVHAALSSVDFCPVAEGNVLNMTVRLNAETTFEGAPVRDDLLPAGTTVQVLVGHLEEMQERGHDLHLVAHMADATQGADATC